MSKLPVPSSVPSDVDVVAAAYRALIGGDLPALVNLLHPDIRVYHSSAELPWGGTYRGIDEFREFVGQVGGALDSELEIDEPFQAGDRVVGVGRVRGTIRANGARFDAREVNVWQVRDGLILGFEVYLDTPVLLAALAGSA